VSVDTTVPVRALAVGPDGVTVAGGGDGRVTLWDVRTRARVAGLGHDGRVRAIAFSPDGRTLATATGSTVTLWDVASRTRTRTLTGHTGTISSVVYSPDGRTLATAGHDRTIRLWAVASP
jgi:WD40 repeat protein